MNWKNSKRDSPPPHNRVVLLSVDGVYYHSIYDPEQEAFVVIGDEQTVFPLAGSEIYWAEAKAEAPLAD